MRITEALRAEHLVFHNLIDHVETTAPKLKSLAEIRSLASTMEVMFAAHSHAEDQLFLGPMAHCFEELGQRQALLDEHAELDRTLRSIRRASSVPKARQALLSAAALARRHFDLEERVVYPLAERVLKRETLESLGRAWMERRNNTSVCVSCENKVCE